METATVSSDVKLARSLTRGDLLEYITQNTTKVCYLYAYVKQRPNRSFILAPLHMDPIVICSKLEQGLTHLNQQVEGSACGSNFSSVLIYKSILVSLRT